MIGKTNALAAGGGIDYDNAPQITFNGHWIKWFVEFYDDVPYWEAWFLSSGTLTLSKAYTVDAWGIGGGGATERNDGYSIGGAGSTNMVSGVNVAAGNIAVTIGAGANSSTTSKDTAGGSTKLGSLLTCSGGKASVDETTAHDVTKYNRFYDASKDEYGRGGQCENYYDGYVDCPASDGWLQIMPAGYYGETNGRGFGAGRNAEDVWGTTAMQGALVIRIPV